MNVPYRYDLKAKVNAESAIDLLNSRHEEIMQHDLHCISFFDKILPMIVSAIARHRPTLTKREFEKVSASDVTTTPYASGVLFNVKVNDGLSVVLSYGEPHPKFKYDTNFLLGKCKYRLINFINLEKLPQVRIYTKVVNQQQPKPTYHFKMETYLDIVPSPYSGAVCIKCSSDTMLINIASEYISFIHPEYSPNTITVKALELVMNTPRYREESNIPDVELLSIKNLYVSEEYASSLKRRIDEDADTITWYAM